MTAFRRSTSTPWLSRRMGRSWLPRPAGWRCDGERWAPAVSDSPDRYFRALASKPGDAATLYAGLGDGPPGTRGTVVVSTDNGRRWAVTGFPGAGSSVWSVATDSREPGLVVAAAIKGEVFVSRDGGESWARASRTFGEIRAVCSSS
ncbi:MAG: hypothetical protein HYU24_00980 [Candidatus Rokubacteria bacterium]|nr:hypothetical protein [Candidatus Rokubacteria bacterium]